MSNTNKTRLFNIVVCLLAAHVVPFFGASVGAPPLVVLSCYLLAVSLPFILDYLIYEVK